MSLNGDLSIIGKEAVHCGERHIKHVPLEYPKQMGCSCELGIKCEDAGKHPLKLNGSIYGAKSAIIDPEKSFKIWEQRPRANLGILTGPENDLFVFDVDIDPEKGICSYPRVLIQATATCPMMKSMTTTTDRTY